MFGNLNPIENIKRSAGLKEDEENIVPHEESAPLPSFEPTEEIIDLLRSSLPERTKITQLSFQDIEQQRKNYLREPKPTSMSEDGWNKRKEDEKQAILIFKLRAYLYVLKHSPDDAPSEVRKYGIDKFTKVLQETIESNPTYQALGDYFKMDSENQTFSAETLRDMEGFSTKIYLDKVIKLYPEFAKAPERLEALKNQIESRGIALEKNYILTAEEPEEIKGLVFKVKNINYLTGFVFGYIKDLEEQGRFGFNYKDLQKIEDPSS